MSLIGRTIRFFTHYDDAALFDIKLAKMCSKTMGCHCQVGVMGRHHDPSGKAADGRGADETRAFTLFLPLRLMSLMRVICSSVSLLFFSMELNSSTRQLVIICTLYGMPSCSQRVLSRLALRAAADGL